MIVDMIEEALVHHGPVPLFKISPQCLRLRRQLSGQRRDLTLFHVSEE